MVEVPPENGTFNRLGLPKTINIYVIFLEIVKKINSTEMGVFSNGYIATSNR